MSTVQFFAIFSCFYYSLSMTKSKVHKKKKASSYKNVFISVTSILLFGILFLAIHYISLSLPATFNSNAASQIAWPMFDGDAQKSGDNTNETTITTATAKNLKQLWQINLSNTSDGSPVYLSNVTTQQGVKNLIFVTTESGSLVAIDDATGAKVWQENTQGSSGVITSSPVIDPGFQYVYSYGKDGKVHKYSIGTGVEITTGGWPFTATTIPNVEKGSSELTIGNG